ncbi:MAG TPA: hypothetical protein VKA55_06785 [Gammaproteobacteria bacterium]|nr:hypothetical protein [Gammaproteobacteria bacterium]
MSTGSEPSPDLERARLDPGAVFGTPEALRDHPDVSRADKLDLLRRWEYDARELSTAESEGMGGGEGSLLDRIDAVLAELTEPPPESG